MPLYIICGQCKRVPVSKLGELCEDCKAKNKEQDREYARRLKEQEQKPRGGKSWLKEVAK
jgi:hypothetical protein